MQIPEKIRGFIADEAYTTDNIGMSDSSVRIFKDKILKIQKCGKESQNEYEMMMWMQGKLPVPQVLAYEILDGRSFLLMGRCEGKMTCEEEYMQNPAALVKLLALGLKKLWSVDISECPTDWRLKHKLAEAGRNIAAGLVDLENVEPDTFGEQGFQNPEALLEWLYENQPEEDLVLSHGDYCLPNIFGVKSEISGYIDLGKTGIADRWCDIALCYRSLSHNYNGRYGRDHADTYADYDDLLLFKELGMEPDWEKIRYYILLDELF